MHKIIFENDNVLIVEKPQGLVCEPDAKDESSLIEAVQRDFGKEIELCHRLDRNTGGLVILSKSSAARESVVAAMAAGTVKKYYRAVLLGNAFGRLGNGKKPVTMTAYHFKDAKKGTVYIYSEKRKYCKEIITEFKPISYNPEQNTSLVEVGLVTGRTHQIRAHAAFLGFPVAGDGKYGRNRENKRLPYKYQALWARKIVIDKSVAEKLQVPSVIVSEPDFK